MARVLTEIDDFTVGITVPEGGDVRNDAAEVVTDIAQRLANRTKRLLRLDGEKAVLGAANTFTTGPQTIQGDLVTTGYVNAGNDVQSAAGHDVNAGRDLNSVRDAIVGRNVLLVGELFYQVASVATPKPRTSIISLNTGVVFGVTPGQALVRGSFTDAACASWTAGQYVAWRILLPTGAVLTRCDVIHSTSTTAPNQFDLMKRSGAVYNLFGASTIPAVTSLCTAPVAGPSVAALATTTVIPTAPVPIDNAVNEYWFTWKSTGLHSADSVVEIHCVWNDAGPING